MTDHLSQTRSQLGELGAMSDKVQASERQILAHAQTLLAGVEKEIKRLRQGARAGVDADEQAYLETILERGRLQNVIAQAQVHLRGDTPPTPADA
jgi:hypothetical protein